ncbi:MAG: efflux RND transporter periplasmic adaptor subunit [Myxococcota bacterium]
MHASNPRPKPAGPRGAVAFSLLAAAVLGCSGDGDFDPGTTARVERRRIERVVVATGTVEPEREVVVRSRIPGIVEKIFVAEGDEVAVGQPLAQIERDLLESRVREARAALRVAQVESRFAKIEIGRQDELKRGGASSGQARDTALARHETAAAAVARAQANLDTLSTELAYANVTSPLDGRVLSIPIEEGTAISPVTAVTGGTAMMSLAGTEKLFLEGRVDENEVARVALLQPARIRTEAFAGRTFEGIVREIAPVGERIQNVTYFEVKIEVIDSDAALLRPRMSGDAEIVTEIVEDALTVPETALRYRGGDIFVETVIRDDPPRFEAADVEIGIVDGDRVEIRRGLDEGVEVRLQ